MRPFGLLAYRSWFLTLQPIKNISAILPEETIPKEQERIDSSPFLADRLNDWNFPN